MNRNNEATSRVINAPNHAADLSNYEYRVTQSTEITIIGKACQCRIKTEIKYCFPQTISKMSQRQLYEIIQKKLVEIILTKKYVFFYIIKITLICRMVNNTILIFLIIYSLHAEVNYNFKIA